MALSPMGERNARAHQRANVAFDPVSFRADTKPALDSPGGLFCRELFCVRTDATRPSLRTTTPPGRSSFEARFARTTSEALPLLVVTARSKATKQFQSTSFWVSYRQRPASRNVLATNNSDRDRRASQV